MRRLRDRLAEAPLGLLAALAIILVVDSALERRRLAFSTRTPLTWKAAWEESRGPAVGAEILCFGDSLVKRGVAAPVVQERAGLDTYNLAVIGGQAPSSYFLLKRALDAGARPRAVVVDFHSALLGFAPRANQANWQELLDTKDAIDLLIRTRSLNLATSLFFQRFSPSIRYREGIRLNVVEALRGQGSARRPMNRESMANWERNRGSLIAPDALAFGGRVAPLDPRMDASRWKVHRVNAEYLGRFLALTRDRGIPVYWLLPPFSPPWQARQDERRLDEPFDRFVRAQAAIYPHLTILDARHSGYRNEQFTDPTHLNRSGAVTFSADLGSIVRKSLASREAGERWRAMPTYREVITFSGLEDTDQTRLSLDRDDDGRRR